MAQMLYQALAGLVVAVHFGFVVFVVLGGLLVLRWKRLAWVHLPAAVWGALIEYAGWICPLTHLEKALRHRAGLAGYEGGFIYNHMLAVLYPEGLTRETQIVLGTTVLLLNLGIYAVLLSRWAVRRSRV